MEHQITIIERTLSDGSYVYDVVFGNALLPAVTERDAQLLAERFTLAIREHSNEEVRTVYKIVG